MNTNQTLEQMREIGLRGMASSYKSQLELPIHHQLEGNELIAHLVEAEKLNRSNERLGSLLKVAKLRLNATPEMVDFDPSRNLSKTAFASLLEGDYLTKGINVHITGAAGCGKSFLACAMGHKACMMGYKTKYYNMNRLIETILLSKAGGTYIKFLNQIEKVQLLILD
ncbi:ATP-binding protein, partial [Arachidicoccus sp.]|uniref:ATP-binding protein n=1 Tax=Arachidicoccus sp. TaxID=1872624 RepID=UPI003D25F044